LNHSTEREEIAKKGHELVRGNHTYQHRLKHMLDICGVK
jgi:spore maturation protein CgeB